MLLRCLSSLAFRPRLDLTLFVFAAAGLGIALLLPADATQEPHRGSYALAIATGSDLRLARGRIATDDTSLDGKTRVLACKSVMSLGSLDIGARCRPAPNLAGALAQGD